MILAVPLAVTAAFAIVVGAVAIIAVARVVARVVSC